MNFDLSKEQQMIVDSVATFVKEESNVERFREMRDSELGWDKEVWKQMGEYGWLGIAFPEQYGGIDGTFIDMALILEQLGKGLAPEPFIPSVVLAGTVLLDVGSEEQKTGVLAPMLEGNISLALAYAEEQSRFNLSDCLTSASKEGDTYSITGKKTWVLNGQGADHIVVVARTSGDQLDAQGLSMFLVDASDAKLTKTVVQGMDGHKTATLEFEGASGQLIGEEGHALPTLE